MIVLETVFGKHKSLLVPYIKLLEQSFQKQGYRKTRVVYDMTANLLSYMVAYFLDTVPC